MPARWSTFPGSIGTRAGVQGSNPHSQERSIVANGEESTFAAWRF